VHFVDIACQNKKYFVNFGAAGSSGELYKNICIAHVGSIHSNMSHYINYNRIGHSNTQACSD